MTAALVLSAGFGTRLSPLTDELAKPLMPVGDRPMLAHVVQALAAGGIRDVVVNTHHRAADFAPSIGSFGLDLQVIHEPEILGTAGGVANAAALLGPSDVVVWNGDILAPDLDVARLVQHRANSELDLLWVIERAEVGSGTIGLGALGEIVRLRGERFGVEVSGGQFLGIQAMSARLRATLPRKGCLVADVALPFLRAGGTIATFAFEGLWDDVGTAESLLRANVRWLERRGLGHWVAPDARVGSAVRLERAIVGSGAVVKGEGLARECVVLPGAELEVPLERAIVGRHGRVVLAPTERTGPTG